MSRVAVIRVDLQPDERSGRFSKLTRPIDVRSVRLSIAALSDLDVFDEAQVDHVRQTIACLREVGVVCVRSCEEAVLLVVPADAIPSSSPGKGMTVGGRPLELGCDTALEFERVGECKCSRRHVPVTLTLVLTGTSPAERK